MRAGADTARDRRHGNPAARPGHAGFLIILRSRARRRPHACAAFAKRSTKSANTAVVVGDRVRFRPRESLAEQAGPAEGVIEQVAQRTTVLTRADSFKGIVQHPIVANADQMLIVAALHKPRTKWGLIDRMLIAGQAGGLATILCLNKVDLGEGDDDEEMIFARAALAHYQTLGITTVETSVTNGMGLESIRDRLRDRVTVLAGHSGVGKSSLISAIVPGLVLKVGDVSVQTEKGRHTTTGARRYPLPDGHGTVIDTPGVKLFGLWNVTAENLDDYFPDIDNGTAPEWRRESFDRIKASLAGNTYD